MGCGHAVTQSANDGGSIQSPKRRTGGIRCHQLDRGEGNQFLENDLLGLKRVTLEKALHASTTHRRDYLNAYVADLATVVDLDVIRGRQDCHGRGIRSVVPGPLLGPDAERYGLNLTVVNEAVDPTFRFMTVDWDGQIRWNPSSSYAMQRLIGLKDRSRSPSPAIPTRPARVVTRSAGLAGPQSLPIGSISICSNTGPGWRSDAAVGKTMVSSQMIDRVAAKLSGKLYEVPSASSGSSKVCSTARLLGGEESAGASFVRLTAASGRPTRTELSQPC